MRDFRGLLVWQKAHALSLAVRRQTLRFPRRQYANFISQITRAAESIPNNIAEGCGAPSQKDFARFLGTSIKSSCELEYQLQVAIDEGILPQADWQRLSDQCIEVRKMLYGLRRKVLDDSEP